MQGKTRKLVQALMYEAIALLMVVPILSWVFEQPLHSSGALAVILSSVALLWNVVFNHAFERWEIRQTARARTLNRRLLHALGFEGGLVIMLTPLIAEWLSISLWEAFLTNASLFVFFFLYSLAFQWAFDRIFDLPTSAKCVA